MEQKIFRSSKNFYQSIPFYSNSIFSAHHRLALIAMAFDVCHNIPTYSSVLVSNGDSVALMIVVFCKPSSDVCFLPIVVEEQYIMCRFDYPMYPNVFINVNPLVQQPFAAVWKQKNKNWRQRRQHSKEQNSTLCSLQHNHHS